MPASNGRPLQVLRALAEPLLALAAALILTLVLTAPFFPTATRLDLTLRPAAGVEPTPRAVLEERVEALGVAHDARVLLIRGRSRLVLTGVGDPDVAERRVGDLIEREGYRRDDFDRSAVWDLEALLGGDPRRLVVVMTIQAAVFGAAGLVLGRRPSIEPLRAAPLSRPRSVLLGIGAGLAAVLLEAILSQFLALVGLPVEEQEWLVELFRDPGTVARLLPWMVLIVPLSEELFFRHYMFRWITTSAGYPAGLVASSTLFALTHFNVSGLLLYLGVGCVFAWAYRQSGRLAAPIAAHLTLNAVVVLASQVARTFPAP
jgi:hypothetical protein